MPDPSIFPDDPKFLARAFADELSPDEAGALRRYLAADSGRRWEFEQLRRAWLDAGRARQSWDAEAALVAIKRRAADDGPAGAIAPVAGAQPHLFSHQRRSRPSVLLRAAWATAAVAILAFGVRSYVIRSTAQAPVAEPITYREVSTRRGETAQLRFPDGTDIRLAPTSRLRYPADMLGASRDIDLEGEAYIVAGHGGRAPLRISTALGSTRDVGTRFVVRALPRRPLEVVVVEGLVSMHPARDSGSSAGADSILVRPGTLGEVTTAGVMRPPRRVRVAAYTAWLDGRLAFADAPLGEVLETLARWRALDYRVADAHVAARRFSGAFNRESTTEILNVLAMTTNVHFDRHGAAYLVRDDTTRVIRSGKSH
jgi:transmembrane sensor